MTTQQDSLRDKLKADLNQLGEDAATLEMRLSDRRRLCDRLESDLRAFQNVSASPSVFGKLFGKVNAESKREELQERIRELKTELHTLSAGIEQKHHDAERIIDEYLLKTDEYYRRDSMRWKAVIHLKHALEQYGKNVQKAADLLCVARDAESIKKNSTRPNRSGEDIWTDVEGMQAVQLVKEGYDAFGQAVEDVKTHNSKASCKLTIKYGAEMTFDIYTHPDYLSLYKIDTLDDALKQLDGLRNAIKAVYDHADTMNRVTIAERSKYHNRLKKSL